MKCPAPRLARAMVYTGAQYLTVYINLNTCLHYVVMKQKIYNDACTIFESCALSKTEVLSDLN